MGWGISWYVNGLLIPELTVVRGRNYTFVVEGGSDPAVPARYHPFYITDDPVGGYQHRSPQERRGVKIFAGVRVARGELVPTGVGRLCSWTPDETAPPADEFPSFGSYQRSLTLVCDEGSPGVVTWTPDARTPDTVYYQVPPPRCSRAILSHLLLCLFCFSFYTAVSPSLVDASAAGDGCTAAAALSRSPLLFYFFTFYLTFSVCDSLPVGPN